MRLLANVRVPCSVSYTSKTPQYDVSILFSPPYWPFDVEVCVSTGGLVFVRKAVTARAQDDQERLRFRGSDGRGPRGPGSVGESRSASALRSLG